jgi:hypothetical protein
VESAKNTIKTEKTHLSLASFHPFTPTHPRNNKFDVRARGGGEKVKRGPTGIA